LFVDYEASSLGDEDLLQLDLLSFDDLSKVLEAD
jgi:hypothetical protein